jgi:radical SAM-linked protein
MRVFQRACVRAGAPLVYSEGFNPHPRMSLVLPRSVGVESDDELLCLWLVVEGGLDAETLNNELPEGIEIASTEISRLNKVPEPVSVNYLISLREDKKAELNTDELLASKMILVQRSSGKGTKTKHVDVRPFIKSINTNAKDIVVECAISPAGTIRVDEILGLLKVNTEDLAEPVKRVKVEWKNREDN